LQTLEESYDQDDFETGKQARAALGNDRLRDALTAADQNRLRRAELLFGLRAGEYAWGMPEEHAAEGIITRYVKQGRLDEVVRTAVLIGQAVPDQDIAGKWLSRGYDLAARTGDAQLPDRVTLSQAIPDRPSS